MIEQKPKKKKVSQAAIARRYEDVLRAGETKEWNIVQQTGNESAIGQWKSDQRAILDTNTLKNILFSEDWPFICCDRIASKIAAQPLLVMRKFLRNGKKATEVVENHTVSKMLENPNDYQTYYQFMYNLVMDLMIAGNSVTWVAFMSKKLVNIPIEQIFIDVGAANEGVQCYRVLAVQSEDYPNIKNAVTIPPQQICHVRRPNPSSMIWGLSPFIPGSKSVMFNRHSTEFLNGYYQKGAQPGMILEVSKEANEANTLRMLKSLEVAHTGRRNQRRNMILPKGVTAKDATHKLADQQLKDYLVLNRETIINLLQIPKHELSIAESGSLGSEEYKTALRNFWNGPLSGTMGMVAQSLTKALRPLLNSPDLYLEFDLSNVEVLQDDKTNKADLAQKMLATHTLNEVRAEVYELPAVPGGDIVQGQMPAFPSSHVESTTPTPVQDPKASEENQITTPTQSLNGAQVTSMIEVVNQVSLGALTVDSAVAIIRVAFAIDEETARAIIGKGGTVQAPSAPTPTEVPVADKSMTVDTKEVRMRNVERLNTILKSADGWWSKREAAYSKGTEVTASKVNERVESLLQKQADAAAKIVESTVKNKSLKEKAEIPSRSALRRKLKTALNAFEEQYVEEIGDVLMAQVELGYDASLVLPFNIPNMDQIEALRARNADGRRSILDNRGIETFANINATTTEQIMSTIERGLEEQKTVDQIVRDIKSTMSPEVSRGRIERIVRTETLTAGSIGQSSAMNDVAKSVPNLKKAWINAGDERVRGKDDGDESDHVSLQGELVDFDKPFTDPRSGAKLMFPRDPAGGPSDVINCRCTFIYMPAENAEALGFEQLATEENPS